MAEGEGSVEEYKEYFHSSQERHGLHTATPLSGAEAYHRFLWHNQHVLFELKLAVIVVVGVMVILACVVYIALQCRAKVQISAHTSNRRDDEKELFGSTETLENLIPAENSFRLKVRRDQEFFV